MMTEETSPPAPSLLEELLERYRAALTERAKAHLEAEMWNTLSSEDRKGLDRRNWLAKRVNDSERAVENRLFLFGEPEAQELLERIEKEAMPLTTARERLKEANAIKEATGCSLKEAVSMRLKEYDTWPLMHTKRGQPFRRKPASRFDDLYASDVPPKVVHIGNTPRGFWSKLRPQLASFAASRFKDADPIIAERLYREFERDLKVLFDEFQSRLSRYRQVEKRDRKLAVSVKFPQVMNACLALCMDPPTRGQPADLAIARSKKKKLARLYHPDVTGGDEGTRAKYEETLSAYSVLEDYNDQLKQVEDL